MSFESSDGRFYSLISDGMGSGELAHKVSNFTSEYFSSMLGSLLKKSTIFHLLNHILRSSEECPTTVDLFEFDLMNGEGVFYKCGAATSYVKRESSIFRIRSETVPVGVMKNVDAERIKVEIKKGDIIVMLSDGATQTPEDTAWLLDLLNREPGNNAKELANRILDAALENRLCDDDISISVIRVCD
jgi:stage II sporulation protein E